MPEPQVTDPLPADLAAELQQLSDALDADAKFRVPPKEVDRNLLVATWNLREFGRVTKKWRSSDDDSPKRDLFSIRAIAEVVSRFDVVALQEVQLDIEALRFLLRALGSNWGLILTDAVKSQAGDNERLAFVFDTRRAMPSGLACELVVPDEVLKAGVGEDALKEQFAKTPYAVAFRTEGHTFILVTLHVVFGKKSKDRIAELTQIAKWMRDWADDTSDEYRQNLMVLGDFNIDRNDDPNYKAFTSQGLSPAPGHEGLPRTLGSSGPDKFFDQIAWFNDGAEAKLTFGVGRANNFEWDRFVLKDLNRNQKSFRVSDHYPLWAEFLLPDPNR
jgi:endonuclease/exonuclease/phosphatase family metal-dependent hydrolase